MELRELRAFVVVAEEGGMSAAARRLHVSQPALSQTVGMLERRLGVKLL
ncbi:LysR family transcriptional regulator, partial [Microbispora rosea]